MQRIVSSSYTIGALSLLSLALCWELSVRLGIIESVFLPPPSLIVLRSSQLFIDGILPVHIIASLKRILTGFGISVLLGISVAVFCYISKIVEWVLSPWVELIRGLSPLALLPAFMLIFGVGFASKVAITVWVTWIPIFLNTLVGVKSVDPLLIKAARSMNSSRMQIVLKVIAPSSAPFILTGLRLAMGSALLVILAAEMFGSTAGLGFYIIESSQTFRILDMYAAILVVGLIGFVMNWVFMMMSENLTHRQGGH